MERDGDRATVIRPEAVSVSTGDGATVASAERDGAVVLLRVRRDDGVELEALAVGVDHPRPGDRVSVEIDPAGVVTVPAWPVRARLISLDPDHRIQAYSHSMVAGGFEERSSATRFTPGTSLTIRLEIVSRSS